MNNKIEDILGNFRLPDCSVYTDDVMVNKCATLCAGLTNCKFKKGIRVKLHNDSFYNGTLESLRNDPLGFNYGVREDSDGKLYWHHCSTIKT